MTNAAAVSEKGLTVSMEGTLTTKELKDQVAVIQDVMKSVMKKDVHYGVVPGTDKPTLLKPGAEKLILTFGLTAESHAEDLSTDDTERVKYRVTCKLYSRSGRGLGWGVGECSSDEEKYAWRKVVCDDEFDEADPASRREKWKKGKGGSPYKVKQVAVNPADVANTILKMGKKRAMVDACLTVLAASDIFEQDIEDIPAEVVAEQRGEDAARPQRASESGAGNKPTEKKTQAKGGAKELTTSKSRNVVDMEIVTGRKNGKEWRKHVVHDSEGGIYNTFSESLGTEARELMASAGSRYFVFTVDPKYGNTLIRFSESAGWPADAD